MLDKKTLLTHISTGIEEQLQAVNPITGEVGLPKKEKSEREKRFEASQKRIKDTYELNPDVVQGPGGKTVTPEGLKELLPDRGRTTTIKSLEDTGAYTPAELRKIRVSLGKDALTDEEKRRVASFQRDRDDWDATSDRTVPSKKDQPKGPTVDGKRVPKDWDSDLKPEVDALRQKRENTPQNYENMRATGERVGRKLMPFVTGALEKLESGVKGFRKKVSAAERKRRFDASQQKIKDIYSVNPDVAQGPDGKTRSPEGIKEVLPNKGKGIEAARDRYNKEVEDFRSEGGRTVPGTGIKSPGRTREVNPETGAAEFNPDKNIPGFGKATAGMDTTTVGGAAKRLQFMRNAQIKPTQRQIDSEARAARKRIAQPGYKSQLTGADREKIIGRVAKEKGLDPGRLEADMDRRQRGVQGSGPGGSYTSTDRLNDLAVRVGRERRQERKDLGLQPRTRDYQLPGGGYDYDAIRADVRPRPKPTRTPSPSTGRLGPPRPMGTGRRPSAIRGGGYQGVG